MVLVGVFPIDLQFDSMSNCFRRMNLWVNIPCFRRHLEDVFSVTIFLLPRRLEDDCKDVCKMSCKNVFKTSSQGVFKISSRRLAIIFWRSLESTLKTSWNTRKCYTKGVKTSSRRLHCVFTKTNDCLGGCF